MREAQLKEGYAGGDASQDEIDEIADAIKYRITSNADILSKCLDAAGGSIQKVLDAIQDVAEFNAPLEEIGSSDMAIMMREVMSNLGVKEVKEDAYSKDMEKHIPLITKMRMDLVDKGMEPEDAFDQACEHYGFDPYDVEEYMAKKDKEKYNYESVKTEAVGEYAEPIYQLCDQLDCPEPHVVFDELVRYMSGDQIQDFVADFKRHHDMNEGKYGKKKKKKKKMYEGVLDSEDEDGYMARAQLYHMAKYAINLHQMIDDREDLEPWVQAKLTKARDYLSVVKHYLEYQKVKQGMAGAYQMDVPESFTYSIAKQASDELKKTGKMPATVNVDGKTVPVKMDKAQIQKILDWKQVQLVDEDVVNYMRSNRVR